MIYRKNTTQHRRNKEGRQPARQTNKAHTHDTQSHQQKQTIQLSECTPLNQHQATAREAVICTQEQGMMASLHLPTKDDWRNGHNEQFYVRMIQALQASPKFFFLKFNFPEFQVLLNFVIDRRITVVLEDFPPTPEIILSVTRFPECNYLFFSFSVAHDLFLSHMLTGSQASKHSPSSVPVAIAMSSLTMTSP